MRSFSITPKHPHGFWDTLKKPFIVLAPMANVTDVAFRTMIAKYSRPAGPSVMWTEFVSADGLIRGNQDVLLRDLKFSEAERPIVAQIFTGDPVMMEQAAALVQSLGFDGIDLNMGCPDAGVEKSGAGASLIKKPELARELILAAKRGAPEIPVSVKTRVGYNRDTLEEWLPVILSAEPAAVTVHARTRKEMSLVPARWERVKRAVEIRDELGSTAYILGNGDVLNVEEAHARVLETGADGVMIGRGIFGKPWLFDAEKKPNLGERLRIAIEHTKLYEEKLGDIKNFALMKKHFKAYCEGFPGAKELRMELMETENAAQVAAIIERFIIENPALVVEK